MLSKQLQIQKKLLLYQPKKLKKEMQRPLKQIMMATSTLLAQKNEIYKMQTKDIKVIRIS